MPSDSAELREIRRDIVVELTNAYYETYRYERPNDTAEQLSAFARDLAENDVDELIATTLKAKADEILQKRPDPITNEDIAKLPSSLKKYGSTKNKIVADYDTVVRQVLLGDEGEDE